MAATAQTLASAVGRLDYAALSQRDTLLCLAAILAELSISPVTPVPALTATVQTLPNYLLAWTFSGTLPATWELWSGMNGVTWDDDGPIGAGFVTSLVVDSSQAHYWRIQGLDSNSNPITPFSNTVHTP